MAFPLQISTRVGACTVSIFLCSLAPPVPGHVSAYVHGLPLCSWACECEHKFVCVFVCMGECVCGCVHVWSVSVDVHVYYLVPRNIIMVLP